MTNLIDLEWEPHDRHWIRLRGPWEMQSLRPATTAPDLPAEAGWSRVRLPAGWQELFGPHAGEVRFRRRFQRPTQLESDERVVLTICEARCEVQLLLNGTPLAPLEQPIGDPAASPCEDALSYDITPVIQQSNLLVLHLRVDSASIAAGPCGLWQPVLLEIITPS